MYINTALCFTGSKFKLLSQIVPNFDYNKKTFIDLFCGSFVVGSNVIDKYESIICNDIISDIVDIHNQIINNSSEFIKIVKKLSVDKQDKNGFNLLRESYNQDNSSEKLYALILCSTNNMLRFNQKLKYNQTFGKRTFNDSTEKKLNNYINYINQYKNKILFKSNHFSEIYPSENSMVYIDPPYGFIKNSNGDIGKKQISEAGYNIFWKKDDDIKLYEYVKNLNKQNISFMMSGVLNHNNNTCWIIDKLISDGFRYLTLDFNYNKVSRVGNKETTEVIIMNY